MKVEAKIHEKCFKNKEQRVQKPEVETLLVCLRNIKRTNWERVG